tara:strand:- start:39 stop:338 length:300 start_codon:yes stop_codon:yes gene_type:complete
MTSKHDGFEELKELEPSPREKRRMEYIFTAQEVGELEEAEEFERSLIGTKEWNDEAGVSEEVGALLVSFRDSLDRFEKLLDETERSFLAVTEDSNLTKG